MWKLADQTKVMTLATCSSMGAWAADVYFARKGNTLYFYSSPKSRHCCDIVEHPQVAATVHIIAEQWQRIQGLQIVGRVEPVEGAAAQAVALATYLAKFPLVKDFFQAPQKMGKAIADKMGRVAPYMLLAETLYITDNTAGFGNRQEYALGRKRDE